jgi:hypothetical protein
MRKGLKSKEEVRVIYELKDLMRKKGVCLDDVEELMGSEWCSSKVGDMGGGVSVFKEVIKKIKTIKN